MERFIHQTVQLIYIDRKRQVSIRDVRVLSVKAGRLKAYCFQARIFHPDRMIDIETARRKEGA